MANFTLATANEKNVWSTKYTSEYVRESGFLPYIGTADNSIIRADKQLTGQNGAVIHFPYYAKLSGAGVTGGTTLMGSEEALGNYSTAVRATLRRNAVAIMESETFKTDLDIANAARSSLKNWSAENLRNDLISALTSMVIPGGSDGNGGYLEDTYLSYTAASAGQRNTFITNNADRVLFGNAISNGSSNVMATALATVTSGMTLSAATLSLAKRIAQKTSPLKINPYRSDATAGREFYVLFVGPEGFRDLRADATITAANTNARERDFETNPLFQGGDLIWDGIIIRQINEMPLVGNVGASSASVGHAVLCGVNAAAIAWSKMPEPRVQAWDYGHQNNAGIMEIRGQAKMSVKGVQTGCVSIFHGAAVDS
jgi:N4-gp56 family major capsid protein